MSQLEENAKPVLTSDRVREIFVDCLSCSTEGAQEVTGITRHAVFNPPSIERHRDSIKEMLAELPDGFRLSEGGGWSFLQACYDRHGTQWTGLHQVMEELFMLGLAAGLVTELLPRELWDSLPGGMPYYAIKL